MPAGTDRRLVACLSFAVQIAGTLTLIAADPNPVAAQQNVDDFITDQIPAAVTRLLLSHLATTCR